MGIRLVVLVLSCTAASLASCGAGPSAPPASAAEPAPPQEVASSNVPPPVPNRPAEETPEAAPEAASDTPPMEWTACSADSNCKAIEIACCDHCNGGALLSVNRAYEAQAIERYRARDCEGTMCTKMACFGPEAVCREGTCSLANQRMR